MVGRRNIYSSRSARTIGIHLPFPSDVSVMLFPGLWLSEINSDAHKVKKSPTTMPRLLATRRVEGPCVSRSSCHDNQESKYWLCSDDRPHLPFPSSRLQYLTVLMLFPGLWLTEITSGRYKVVEVPDNKAKRGRSGHSSMKECVE
ncbi:hypothetical protein MLD38_003909 [Melastoma candidum]|uniref:Uncharacterized protein n=1 Tax=Melastoma candidum TaxID=119954 RepID=A0ACB9S5D8_9MYRT|nr:hypothetical protein MLD38_003909 [Melastoma candidum]